MDLAISPAIPGLSVPQTADLCAWAEGLGYRHAWLSEVAGPDAFVLGASIAAATRHLEMGVAVVPAYTRTPAVLAMAAGSVSQILGGRPFRLGVGASSEVIVEGWNGVPLAHPLTRVRETVEAVRAGLGLQGDFQGRTVAMRRFRNASPPTGPVEIYVGALNPGMLRVAGAVGDGVCLNLMPARVVVRQLEEIRAGAAGAGRVLPDGFGVMARLQLMITDDRVTARQVLRQALLGPYMAQPAYNRFLGWIGYPEEALVISSGFAAGDREMVAAALHDRLVDDITLLGPEREVRARLDEFAAAGVTVAAVSVLSPERSVVEDTLRKLAA